MSGPSGYKPVVRAPPVPDLKYLLMGTTSHKPVYTISVAYIGRELG